MDPSVDAEEVLSLEGWADISGFHQSEGMPITAIGSGRCSG